SIETSTGILLSGHFAAAVKYWQRHNNCLKLAFFIHYTMHTNVYFTSSTLSKYSFGGISELNKRWRLQFSYINKQATFLSCC
ncbi:MAG: hypothetical protein ACJA0G_002340, partial [Kangiellaceae bacterium]